MSKESRRRLTLAAGAIVAGAVIPIAAAASAWADDETETFLQLVGQGLNYYEAYEVVQAEDTGLPVEVSYDGNLVVETNQIVNPLTGAVAESGPNSDVAAAIATNSPAILNQTIAEATRGSNDVAFADGGGSFAFAGNEVPDTIANNNDTATAIGTYSSAFAVDGNNDSATDIGSNSLAEATANSDTVYDVGSGVGNGANSISAGGDNDFVFGFGNGLPNTDVVNTGIFDIVTPQSGDNILSSAAATAVTSPSTLAADATSTTGIGTAVFPDAPGTDAFTIGNATFDPYTGGTDITPGTEGFDPLTQGTGTSPFFDTGSVDGQNFEVFGTASGSTAPAELGTITTTENVTNLFNITNTGFDVTGESAVAGGSATDLPAIGTVVDVTNFGSGFENIYTDLPGAAEAGGTTAAGTVTDTLVTPFGDSDLSSLVSAFDLTALDPGAAFGLGADAGTAAVDAAGSIDPLAFLGL